MTKYSSTMVCVLCMAISSGISAGSAMASIEIVERPDMGAKKTHYIGNQAPLPPSPMARLPLGSVQAAGWLGRQLELMADGQTPLRMTSVSPGEASRTVRSSWSGVET